MENVIDTDLTTEKRDELIKKCNEYHSAIGQLLEQINQDEAEVVRLNAESWAMLAQLRKAA